jgi:hypothetical protein
MGLFVLGPSLTAQAVAAATGRRAVGLSIIAGYTFVSYVIYGLSGTVTGLQHLRPLTIWRWYLLNDPLASGLGWSDLAVLAAVCVTVMICGTYVFGRRSASLTQPVPAASMGGSSRSDARRLVRLAALNTILLHA